MRYGWVFHFPVQMFSYRYKKEIDDLEKIHKRILEKYELHAHNQVSNSMIDIKGAIENLKKFEQ